MTIPSREVLKRLRGTQIAEFLDLWHDKQLSIFDAKEPFLFLMGGNGAGKTTVGSYWLVTRVLGFDPATNQVFTYEKRPDFYAVGPDFKHIDRVMLPAIRGWIPPGELLHEDKSSRILTFKSGRRILLKSVESGAEKFQGDEIDAAWVDEDPEKKEVWDELLGRTFRRNGRILVTMTPWKGTRWLHHWMFSPDAMTEDQKKIIQMALDENPYYRKYPEKLARAHKQWSGMTKRVRFYGEFHLMAGNPVFPPEVRKAHEEKYRREPALGQITAKLKMQLIDLAEDEEDKHAWIRVWQGPKVGHEYVMGVDVGGGNPTGDYHAAVIVDCETGYCVALMHTRMVEPREFGDLVVRTATAYNRAFIVPEGNNHGIAVIDKLKEHSYARVYMRTTTEHTVHGIGKQMGFWSSKKTKVDAVDLMAELVREEQVKITDPLMYNEMFHYYHLRDERTGTYGIGNQNPEGHDDTLSALFLACVGLRQLGFVGDKPSEKPVELERSSVEQIFFEDAAGRDLTQEEVMEMAEAEAIDPFAEEESFADFGDLEGF